MQEQLAQLPMLLTAHLQLVLVALLIGASCSIPLGFVVARRPRWQSVVLSVAGLVQTIPSLALLAAMVPLLALVGHVSEAYLGIAVSSIGYLPALIALTLYSMLPMLRNTVTGLQGVDRNLLEAADGVGMTPAQRLRRVEIPQALPTIIAGVRTASAWVVGMAVLATPVGAASLGNYIFTGLQTHNFAAVGTGCVAAAALALLVDGLIAAIEWSLVQRRRTTLALAMGSIVGLYAYAGVYAAREGLSDTPTLRVGAKTFTESFVLAEILRQKIACDSGGPVRLTESLGSNVVYDALKKGAIDAYVEYTGTVWTTLMQKHDVSIGRDAILAEVTQFLQRDGGVVIAAALGFENTYTLAMREADAARLGIVSIDQLAPVSHGMQIASDYEFFGRSEWRELVRAYHLDFARQRTMDPALMYPSIDDGEVDVITAYTSDGRIAANHLRVLEEPKRVIPPYDAIVLVGPRLQKNRKVMQALRGLEKRLDLPTMQRLNYAVDHGGESPATVAQRFLADVK